VIVGENTGGAAAQLLPDDARSLTGIVGIPAAARRGRTYLPLMALPFLRLTIKCDECRSPFTILIDASGTFQMADAFPEGTSTVAAICPDCCAKRFNERRVYEAVAGDRVRIALPEREGEFGRTPRNREERENPPLPAGSEAEPAGLEPATSWVRYRPNEGTCGSFGFVE
jgi:hypothetical protein